MGCKGPYPGFFFVFMSVFFSGVSAPEREEDR